MEKMPRKLFSSSHWPLHEGGCWSLGDVFIHPAEKRMGPLCVGKAISDRSILAPWPRCPF